MTTLIDGKAVSQKIKTELKEQVTAFTQKTKIQPTLATILVGEDAASQVYIRNKIKSTEACGMRSIHHQKPADLSEADLLKLITVLNSDKSVHGILVQLPLPSHINAEKVIRAIDPLKDVDCFHPFNVGLLMTGQAHLQPCTPLGVMKLLEHYDIDLQGKDVVVIGRSNIVGKPQAMMMIQASATVTVCHSRTQDLAHKIKQADVVVAAIGRAKFVKAEWLKKGAVVIDVGMNRDENGKLCGDVDFEFAKQTASYITPVPGGVGPMTIAMLLVNTLRAAQDIHNMNS